MDEKLSQLPMQEPQKPAPTGAPEDMFGDVDPITGRGVQSAGLETSAPALSQETPPPAPQLPPADPPGMQLSRRRLGRGSRIRLIALGGALALFAVVIVVFYVIPRFTGGTGEPINANQNDNTNAINQIEPVNTEPKTNVNTNTSPIVVDSDGDGLTDQEEGKLGTLINEADTDKDGLTDRQEAKIYNTNPRVADTDSDGYDDGEEVRNFYNPNGKGKLLDVKNEIANFESGADTE